MPAIVIGLTNSTPTIASATDNLIPAFMFIIAVPFGVEKLGLKRIAGQAKFWGTIVCVGGAMLLSLYHGKVVISQLGFHWKYAESTNEDVNSAHSNFFLGPFLLIISSLTYMVNHSVICRLRLRHGYNLKRKVARVPRVREAIKRDFMCLYCNYRCQPFSSLEVVRKHMEAKNHRRVHYGDGDDDEEAKLEEFYDHTSRFVDKTGKQIVLSDDTGNSAELGSGGPELIITTRRNDGVSVRTLGSREFAILPTETKAHTDQ
ncbi:WAT1-related protein [Capsicum baccatum]|uniref:WAT1-related protein n=1 Tax=Capsicum baccatum TaxID=33114 RepID=A0A2G2VG81_CAPBA|nr:WAT1-related protein [Capsicum baccatum]